MQSSKAYIPPCPDPEKYVLVRSKEGNFWRRKRGSFKKAALNTAFSTNVLLAKMTGPVASNITRHLVFYLRGLQTGRLTLYISNALRNGMKEKGCIDLASLKGMDFQPDYPLEKLLLVPVQISQPEGRLSVKIPVTAGNIKRQNRLLTHYYFELIILWGDADFNDLKTDTSVSKLFSFDEINATPCSLVLPIPGDQQWIGILKVSCLEGNELAHHPKHYGMKVVSCAPIP